MGSGRRMGRFGARVVGRFRSLFYLRTVAEDVPKGWCTLWIVPGTVCTVKFVAETSEQAEREAREFIEQHCKDPPARFISHVRRLA